jgi:methyltransferase (TIGR00027 family)
MVSIEVPGGVGRTALGMARVRAEESVRPDRLFDDPYARAFVDAAPGALPDGAAPGGGLMAGVLHGAVIRTRFYDEALLDACAGGCRQVVIVAAGLDSRAFRLPWPDGVRVLEIDQPDVLAFKEQVLAGAGAVPGCRRVPVAADLRHDWPARLVAAGFRPAEPTVWLVEGLLVYLTADEAATLLRAIGVHSAAGSRLACDLQGTGTGERPTARFARLAAMWKGGLGRATAQWLAEDGWQVRVDLRDAVAESYGRPAPAPSDGGYIVATRP